MTLPLALRLTTRQRAERAWRHLKSSRREKALAGVALVALLFALVSLRPATVYVTGSDGPLKGHCGLGYYVFGAPQPAVETACRNAYAGHATEFFMLLVVATGLAGYLFGSVQRPARAELAGQQAEYESRLAEAKAAEAEAAEAEAAEAEAAPAEAKPTPRAKPTPKTKPRTATKTTKPVAKRAPRPTTRATTTKARSSA